MALDGAFLNVIANEIQDEILNGRVEKITQPSKEEIVIAFRYRKNDKTFAKKLILSASADSPRIHFTNISLENPQSPPMFCMLLRKHIGCGKLVAVRQNNLDRVLMLDFEAVNELGDLVVITIIIEIMGRHSNIILLNTNGRVIDSIKRVSNDMSSVRMILPNIEYELPPAQDKLNPITVNIDEIMQRFENTHAIDPAKALLSTLEGISPILSREIISKALKGQDIDKNRLSDFYKTNIKNEILSLRKTLVENEIKPTIVCDMTQKINDFTFIDVTQYGINIPKSNFDTVSELLDNFYANRNRFSRMKQRSHDLLKVLMNTTERISKKLSLQAVELEECGNREILKIYGDLINSNIYAIENNIESVVLQNFYDEELPMVEIKLDKRLSPAQNAQYYYTEYRKAGTAETMLTELIKKGEQELIYIESVFDAVSRTQGESELLEIRTELAEQGYIRQVKKKGKGLKAQPPIQYKSSDGFTILCGRNNIQNDKLTMKQAKNYDMWLHTQGIAGSHVIIVSDNKEISDTAITEAAIIASYNSKGRESAQVAVDYTLIKYVKKPIGAKPGMVIFTNYSTAYVTPNESFVQSLLTK